MWWGSWVLSKHRTMIDEGFCQLNAVFNIRHFLGETSHADPVRNHRQGSAVREGCISSSSARVHNDVPLGVHDVDKVPATLN